MKIGRSGTGRVQAPLGLKIPYGRDNRLVIRGKIGTREGGWITNLFRAADHLFEEFRFGVEVRLRMGLAGAEAADS